MKRPLLLISLCLFSSPLFALTADLNVSGGMSTSDSPSVAGLTCISGTTSEYFNSKGNTFLGDSSVADKVTITGSVDQQYNEAAAASDGTLYNDFLTSATVSATAVSDGVSVLRGRYNWYVGDNGNFIAQGVEGVAASYAADESMTGRGGYFRTYIAPGATMRSSFGADISARASYLGGTEIGAESGTAFVGARVWMAPYFTAVSTPNVNNFHGLWIYNEHPTVPVTNAIMINNAASGGYTNGINMNAANIGTADIVLQNGETISNKVNGTIALGGAVTATSFAGDGSGLTNLPASGGGGKFSVTFLAGNAILPNTLYPDVKKVIGTNFSENVVAFDSATAETCYWNSFVSSGLYQGGNLTAYLVSSSSDSASVGVSTATMKWNYRFAEHDSVKDATTTPAESSVTFNVIGTGTANDIIISTAAVTAGLPAAYTNAFLQSWLQRMVSTNDNMSADLDVLLLNLRED